MVSISANKINIRSGPGKQYRVKWEYGKGFPLQVIDSQDGWYKVKDFENDTGWVFKQLVNGQGHMIVKVNKSKKSTINIRSGPGTKYDIVGKAYYGVVFKTLEQRSGWAKVKHHSGVVGWIKRTLLWGF